jgi:hypothetical protein
VHLVGPDGRTAGLHEPFSSVEAVGRCGLAEDPMPDNVEQATGIGRSPPPHVPKFCPKVPARFSCLALAAALADPGRGQQIRRLAPSHDPAAIFVM